MTREELAERQQRRLIGCQGKTESGNVFATRGAAWGRTLYLRRCGIWVEAFQCPVCRRWHIGKPTISRKS